MLKYALLQLEICNAKTLAEKEQNVERAIKLIDTIDEKVDLIVLPELATCGYGEETFQQLQLLAEDEKGPSIQRFVEVAKKRDCVIGFGFPYKNKGSIYCAYAVVHPNGEVQIAEKIHIPEVADSLEKAYFQRGTQTISFELNGIRCGVVICYDYRFPQFVYHYVRDNELDIVIHPVTMVNDVENSPSWKEFVQTRALEHQVYWLSVNRAGKSFGSSLICPPLPTQLEKMKVLGTEEEIYLGSMSKATVDSARQHFSLRTDELKNYKNETTLYNNDFSRP